MSNEFEDPNTSPDGRLVTEVALGVLIDRAAGRFFMGSRPLGKPYAGYWEIPGGKLEKGETVTEALIREYREELDVELTDITPWFVLEHAYEHAYVRLHYCRVWGWRGEPKSMEHQAFDWFEIGRLPADRLMLPMMKLVMKRLALPEVVARVRDESKIDAETLKASGAGALLITPEDEMRKETLEALAKSAGLQVVSAFQVKSAKEAAGAHLQEALCAVTASGTDAQSILAAKRQRAPIYVSGNVQEIERWRALGAHGVCLNL